MKFPGGIPGKKHGITWPGLGDSDDPADRWCDLVIYGDLQDILMVGGDESNEFTADSFHSGSVSCIAGDWFFLFNTPDLLNVRFPMQIVFFDTVWPLAS